MVELVAVHRDAHERRAKVPQLLLLLLLLLRLLLRLLIIIIIMNNSTIAMICIVDPAPRFVLDTIIMIRLLTEGQDKRVAVLLPQADVCHVHKGPAPDDAHRRPANLRARCRSQGRHACRRRRGGGSRAAAEIVVQQLQLQ